MSAALTAAACQRPAEPPQAPPGSTVSMDPIEIAVAPPSAEPSAAAERPSAFGSERPESPAQSARSIGIPSCDAYLAMLDDCDDPAIREAMQPAIQATREAWIQVLESGPEARSALETACKTARDAFPNGVCGAPGAP